MEEKHLETDEADNEKLSESGKKFIFFLPFANVQLFFSSHSFFVLSALSRLHISPPCLAS